MLNLIETLKPVDVETLNCGLRLGVISESDVFEWASNKFLSGSYPSFVEEIISMGVDFVCRYREMDADESNMKIWLLASLIKIQDSNEVVDLKVSMLQEVYSLFKYPEIMSSCSIYAQDGIDPISAMESAISSLKREVT